LIEPQHIVCIQVNDVVGLSHLGSFFLFDLCPYDKYDNTYRGKVNDFLRIGVLRRKELSSVLILSKLSGFKVSNWPAPG
ncbi:hypothetical protein, partial [Candidatus Hakubella thermalkaliphila]|uniref:hypothetical protein n=2 Tax=Candidatus Hakubella thermalkaliphila TaxID=2754717 RepID=UPI001C6163FF